MLITAAEKVTPDEIQHSPEIPTLVALDATLLATINLFHIFYPYLGEPFVQFESPEMVRSHEDKIAESITNSAFTLRKKISRYYAAVKKNSSKPRETEEIAF